MKKSMLFLFIALLSGCTGNPSTKSRAVQKSDRQLGIDADLAHSAAMQAYALAESNPTPENVKKAHDLAAESATAATIAAAASVGSETEQPKNSEKDE